MRKIKKASIVVLAIVLLFGTTVPSNADLISSGKVSMKIDTELQLLLDDVSSGERIPVDVWLYETSTAEEREEKILSKIGVNKVQIAVAARSAVSAEMVDQYIAVERDMYAAERMKQYTVLQKEYSNIQALQTTRKTDTRLFYSQYAPMISTELTPKEIKLLAQDSRVESICYSPDVTIEDEGTVSGPTIGADYTRDTLGYTGSGIKIGMIERYLPRQCYVENEIIYECTDIHEPDYGAHASIVASIMVGKSTSNGVGICEGIVPDATLYATNFERDQDWRARVEWLISQKVHVINMSGRLSDGGGTYGNQERWLDHVAINHNIHFVNSSGNEKDAYVTSPGMAYNILTVGAIDDKNTTQFDDDVLYEVGAFGTSYREKAAMTNKPDLVAPGVNIYTIADDPAFPHGTSFAAAHVTAVIAQLCQRFPSLRVLQAGVKAILTASISHSEHAYTPVDEEYDKFGAGVVNARAAFETVNAYRMVDNSFPANSPANAEKVYTFSAPADQRVRVSLTWLKYAALSNDESHLNDVSSEYNLADLDLYVIHPNGSAIHYSDTLYNNTEIVDFVTSTAGTYQMVVSNRLASQRKIEFGLSWWFE